MRWKRQGREDILIHIAINSTDPHNQHAVFVTKSCPFLKREETGLYSCAIHETKPFYCKIYPNHGMCEHEESMNVWQTVKNALTEQQQTESSFHDEESN